MHKLILLVVSLLGTIAAHAVDPGWYKFPIFSDTITTVVESTNKVYYQSKTSLFSFNPSDNESYSYSSINKLTGDDISNIYYNYDKRYLLIVYSDCNMDVLYDDGTLINLPEIRDAKQITEDKTINDVAFGEDRIGIATSFGIVIYDDKKMEVRESGIYNQPIRNIAIMNGHILIFYRNDDAVYAVYGSPLDERHNSIDKFTRIFTAFVDSMVPLDDNRIAMRRLYTHELYIYDINFDTYEYQREDPPYNIEQPMRRFDGGFYSYDDTRFVTYVDGELSTSAKPEMLSGQVLSSRDLQQVWAGDEDGVALYDISSSTPTVLYDKMLPADATTVSKVGLMKWSPDGDRLYFMNLGASVYKTWCQGDYSPEFQTANILDADGFLYDVSLKEASAQSSIATNYQKQFNNLRLYGDPVSICEDPDDSSIYYCATNVEGVYVCKYNEQTGEYEEIGKYYVGNAPVKTNSSGVTSRTEYVGIDPAGNLWIGHLEGWIMLPSAKRKLFNPSAITTDDWKIYTKVNSKINNTGAKDMNILFCKKSTMAFYYSGDGNSGFVAVDTKGTYDDLSDDVALEWLQFTDQDGNSFATPSRITHMIEDERGCVWVGTSAGVFELTTPSNAINPTMTVRRIKVPRNDGTNYADYLLDSDVINWIAVDPSDRKWIATENSGLFLVSEIGDEILVNYYADNSSLPSNQICCVECDTHSNTVYVGTTVGMYSFLSDSSPSNDSLDNIYAYPNPVRIDYSGDVTIAGLMENTIVKIADTAGRVIYQTRSEGGMATWPVTNQAGKRVKTGVYYIFTANYTNEQASGAVAKILVVN